MCNRLGKVIIGTEQLFWKATIERNCMINLSILPIKNLPGYDWDAYFENNDRKRLHIDLSGEIELSKEEKKLIFPSIRLFQMGESSDGRHLLETVKKYVEKSGDTSYQNAMKWFVKEENCHSGYLKKYMEYYQIPGCRNSFLNQCFRKLRKMGGLKCEVAILITAEMVALSYYSALGKCTGSEALKSICRQMLHDELRHVVFQSYTLYQLKSSRLEAMLRIFFMEGTIAIVWLRMKWVLQKGGYSFKHFAGDCLGYLAQSIEISRSGEL